MKPLQDLQNKAAKHGVQPTHEWLGKIFRQILEGQAFGAEGTRGLGFRILGGKGLGF